MTSQSATTPPNPLRFSFAWLLGYLLLLGLVTFGLFYGRQRALAIYGSESAQAEWDAWREDAKKLADESGPVKRRIPKSIEPPALVLMRDHFVVCLAGSLLLTSVLFGTFMILVRGAFAPGGQGIDPSR
jgi:hypothetical protein